MLNNDISIPNRVKELLIIQGNRVFVDIAYRGCGSGCHYCYVKSCAQPQELVDYHDIDRICFFIMEYCKQNEVTILSFCPNTEPFKSRDSSSRVLYIIKKLINCNLAVQISTKEIINNGILRQLQDVSSSIPIFVNVSLPIMDDNRSEPFAGDQEERAKNILRIKEFDGIKCGLYIKPLFPQINEYIEKYYDIIKNFQPDYVCLGVEFSHKTTTPCLSMYDKKIADYLVKEQGIILEKTISLFKMNVDTKFVFSSVCYIAQQQGIACNLDLWRVDSRLCDGCVVRGKNEYRV